MSLVKISFAGKLFHLENAGGMDQIARQMESGSYEPPLPLLMMATLVRSEGTFIDVGANTGIYSILAGVIARDREIHAFEPHPEVMKAFLGNINCNNLGERVHTYGIGLSDKAGTATLYLPDQGHGLIETSASLEIGFQAVASSIEIDIKRLDEMDLNSQVAVIKVDIEGHEYAFLQGARQTIQRDRPIIFAEVLHGAQRNRLGQFLRETSYIDFRLRPDIAIHDGDVMFDDTAWNHAFVPVERLDKFREACDSCGLVVLRRFTTHY